MQSLAASAASVVLMGADTAASPVAQVMIHLSRMTTSGNQLQHQHGAEILESVTESILAAYFKKCKAKTTRDALRGMMDNETFLTAQQALELGLLDEIMDDAPVNIMNAAGRLPDIVQLRDAYRRRRPEKANQTRLRRIALAEATFEYTETFLGVMFSRLYEFSIFLCRNVPM